MNLSYDYENRLNSVVSGAMNIAYSYDGEGRRISSNNGATVTNYLYDGKDVVLERNNAGVTTTSYLRNPNTAGGIGGIINSQQGANPENYYSYDGLGSVANLSDVTGTSLQSYSYDAFGNTLTSQGTLSNNHQFLTKEIDLFGLIYFGARYYDPTIGRFITQDPLGMVDGPNMYLYCGNDPVNLFDAWGLCVEQSWWERWFWRSTGERNTVWEWDIEKTIPPDDVLKLGFFGSVDVNWRNRSHYEQQGYWVWDYLWIFYSDYPPTYQRRWGYKWGEKTQVTTINAGGYQYNPYEAYPAQNPNP